MSASSLLELISNFRLVPFLISFVAPSLLRSRFWRCHAALRDIPKNGCGGDYVAPVLNLQTTLVHLGFL